MFFFPVFPSSHFRIQEKDEKVRSVEESLKSSVTKESGRVKVIEVCECFVRIYTSYEPYISKIPLMLQFRRFSCCTLLGF